MTTDSRTHTPTLDNDDLETILSIARNEQSGRITRRETEILVAAYRAHDGLVEALRGFGDDYMVSDRHHPDHVLIPRVVFDRVCAALEAAGITEAGK